MLYKPFMCVGEKLRRRFRDRENVRLNFNPFDVGNLINYFNGNR